MTEPRKFMRMVAEFEVEIIDPVASRAHTFDWAKSEHGGLEMVSYDTDEECVAAAVNQVVVESLRENGGLAGFKWLGGSTLPRLVENGVYSEITFPAMPVRRSDGTYADPE